MTKSTNRYSKEQKGKGVEVVKEPCRYYESSSEEDEPFKDVYSIATLWGFESHESQCESLLSLPDGDSRVVGILQ